MFYNNFKCLYFISHKIVKFCDIVDMIKVVCMDIASLSCKFCLNITAYHKGKHTSLLRMQKLKSLTSSFLKVYIQLLLNLTDNIVA